MHFEKRLQKDSKMNDAQLNVLIGTYTKYVQNLRSKIELGRDGTVKQARRRRHIAVLEIKLERALEEQQQRSDKSYALR